MSTMEARVAIAIGCINDCHQNDQLHPELCWRCTEAADRAIKAMRDPTDAMVDGGIMALFESGPSTDLALTASSDTLLVWQAMIDAAISESDGEKI